MEFVPGAILYLRCPLMLPASEICGAKYGQELGSLQERRAT